jgi:[CysO sulfur-carrier protein]-thiocarboxylate-dependent cysteine synthase
MHDINRIFQDGSQSMIFDERAPCGSIANFELLADRVGGTPVWELPVFPQLPVRLLVKLEGYNPTGSVKDRACVAMLWSMLSDPNWHPSKVVLDASSGSMGCSIAYFGRSMGAEVHIVASSKLTPEKRFFIEYFGADIEVAGTFTVDGNNYCRQLVENNPDGWYFLDQLHNPANPVAHMIGTGPEILTQVPDVSAVIGTIGSGGTLLGVGRCLKKVKSEIKIIAVEASSGTRLPGTAALVDGDYRTPFIEEGFAEKVFDWSLQVSESEAVQMARMLTPFGLFGGLQTCAVVAAAERAVVDYGLTGDVVVISGDTAWKNVDALRSKVPPRLE